MRHLQTRFLWIQEVLAENKLALAAIPSAENPSDLGTKYLAAEVIRKLLKKLGVGRLSESAWKVPASTASQNLLLVVMACSWSQPVGAADSVENESVGQGFDWLLGLIFIMAAFGVYAIIEKVLWHFDIELMAVRRGNRTSVPVSPAVRGVSSRASTLTVGTQSQVTYRRDLADPRFQPLGALQQGAWDAS